MILSRIQKRVWTLSEMIVLLDNSIAFSSIVRECPSTKFELPHVSFQVRYFERGGCFCRLKSSLGGSSRSPTRFLVIRVSRATRNEAQKVLFDYLHCTRSLSFTDAEHISKNSPHFISALLSKVNAQDIPRTLTKFLRYNPINEFEPFLESLGLHPSELSPLIPRHLMYLSDDSTMFENFRMLCDYGIPRGKIGRVYKEAREIFRYEHGVLASRLEAYENLGLSRPMVIKLVTCCPSLLVGGLDTEFASVLFKLKGVQVGGDWLGQYLSDRRTYNWRRILDTLNFLDKVGYKGERLGSLLKTYPALVIEGSGKEVYVLFGRFLKMGLQVNEIYSLFIDNPEMLSDKCMKNLWKALDFLIDIRMEMQFISRIILTHMKLIGSCYLKGPQTVCASLKVGKEELCQILKEEPLKLLSFACKLKSRQLKPVPQDLSKHMEKTAFLLKLGYVENSDEMVKALKKFRGRGDQLQERFDCLVKAGLDHNTVSEIIKHAPMILNQSKDVIEKKIHSLTDHLGYPIESLVAFPVYLCYDIERINQRFSMYMWLRERDAVKPRLSLSTIISCAEARFVKYFVNVHPYGPETWERIKKSSTSTLTVLPP